MVDILHQFENTKEFSSFPFINNGLCKNFFLFYKWTDYTMRRVVKLTVCIAVLAMLLPGGAMSSQLGQRPLTQQQVAKVVSTLNDGLLVAAKKAGAQSEGQAAVVERSKVLDPIIRAVYDMPKMARLSVGTANWDKMPPDVRAKLVEAFAAFSVANYAARFTVPVGAKLATKSVKAANNGDGFMVETVLIPKAGEDPVKLNYLVQANDKGEPRIADVFLAAAISEIAVRRSEFASIVRRGGVDALISALEEKTEKLSVAAS